MEAKIKDLIKDIESAFADTPYPTDGRIRKYELTVSFGGLHWTDVPWELLFYHRFEVTSFERFPVLFARDDVGGASSS